MSDLKPFISSLIKGAANVCTFCVVSGIVLFTLGFFAVEEIMSVNGVCNCVYLGLGTLITAVAAKLIISRRFQFRRLLFKWTRLSIFAPRSVRRSSDILSENYLERLNHRTLMGIVIILIVSIGAVAIKDTGTLVVSILVIGLLFIQTALTEFRVLRGYFGANAFEAQELIAFIVSQKNDGDNSPGIKVSRPYHIDGDADADSEDFAGART